MFFAINPICYKLLHAILLNIWQALMPHIHFSGERLHLVVPFVKYFLIGRKKLQQTGKENYFGCVDSFSASCTDGRWEGETLVKPVES